MVLVTTAEISTEYDIENRARTEIHNICQKKRINDRYRNINKVTVIRYMK